MEDRAVVHLVIDEAVTWLPLKITVPYLQNNLFRCDTTEKQMQIA
jgi:hypothetical protein